MRARTEDSVHTCFGGMRFSVRAVKRCGSLSFSSRSASLCFLRGVVRALSEYPSHCAIGRALPAANAELNAQQPSFEL